MDEFEGYLKTLSDMQSNLMLVEPEDTQHQELLNLANHRINQLVRRVNSLNSEYRHLLSSGMVEYADLQLSPEQSERFTAGDRRLYRVSPDGEVVSGAENPRVLVSGYHNHVKLHGLELTQTESLMVSGEIRVNSEH